MGIIRYKPKQENIIKLKMFLKENKKANIFKSSKNIK